MIKHSQNFLLNPHLVSRLVDTMDIQTGDTIIDIGAGEGIITEALLERFPQIGTIMAVEIDKELSSRLETRFENNLKVGIVNQDILDLSLPKNEFKVVANIPFNITSSILNILLNPENSMSKAYIVIQEEAAAMYGGDRVYGEESLKSLLAYPYYDFQIAHYFKSHDFVPEPQINIVLLEITRKQPPLISLNQFLTYRDFITFVSKDRVGEGAWKGLFRQKSQAFFKRMGLKLGAGIKQQSVDAILSAYKSFTVYESEDKKFYIKGAYEKHLQEQIKIAKVNRTRRDRTWHTK
ncbi:MAG: rRNA (Adenine-N(6)-)-methyltransferase [candidate division WS6 bacterium GW2011_GWF2_39_15]|uniref:rRNA (Adenine-N(6)-)-methyltransferase n=1 Tax=candidate division WS6 bacterium GW2011_GWF2_39_15 TaxID=1619100 RepID=A0A0G0MSP4_9BACT|nr:MAG: rRNA (Adenine-N(6)-)-methyltransferase [candidate division WS6 bacterium GW2011_GWF2_39_15]